MDTPVTSVDFHFDIMCPWAYQASIWMREVRDRLGLKVRWRFFSLYLQAIATTFQPYLEARDWVTIQKETP
jgi:2-hydroxychromene-2-carboxylate isomerase